MLISLYWLVFLLPGYSLFLFLRKKKNIMSDNYNFKTIILSFVGTSFLLSPVMIISYISKLEYKYFGLYFVALVIFGSIAIVNIFKNNIELKWNNIIKKRMLFICPLILIIVIDVLAFSKLKTYVVPGDAAFHVSRMFQLVNYGFSNNDPRIVGEKLYVYIFSLYHAILAIPAYLLSIEPIEIWEKSIYFFRVLEIATIYTFFFEVFKKRTLAIFMAFVLISYTYSGMSGTGLFLLSRFSVSIFYVVALIYLKEYLKKDRLKINNYFIFSVPLIVSSFYHPSVYMYAFYFEILFVVLLWQGKITFKEMIYLSIPMLLPIIIALYGYSNASGFIGKYINYDKSDILYFSDRLFSMRFEQLFTNKLMMMLLGLMVFLKYVRTSYYKTVVLLSVFVPIAIIYNPIICSLLLNKSGDWLLNRFKMLNIISNYLPFLPLYFGVKYVLRYIKNRKNKLLFVCAIALIIGLAGIRSYDEQKEWSVKLASLRNSRDLLPFRKFIKPDSVIISDIRTNSVIPTVLKNKVLNAENPFRHHNIVVEKLINNAPNYSLQERLQLIKEYNIKYMILPINMTWPADSHYTKLLAKTDKLLLYSIELKDYKL